MHGLRHFFAHPRVATPAITVRGIGIRERMAPGIVNRPGGTGDYLFMFFYDPVQLTPDAELERANSLLLWTPKHGHYYGNTSRRWRHSWLHCHGTFVAEQLETLSLPTAVPLADMDPLAAERWLLALYQELTGPGAVDAEITQSFLAIWLREVRRRWQAPPSPTGPPRRWTALKSELETSFAERHTLSALADRLGISPQHLSATFKRHFGLGPIDYVIQLRLTHAVYLLRDQSLTVGEVAQRVGYDDIYQFSRLFKKHMGVSPSAVQRRLQRGARP